MDIIVSVVRVVIMVEALATIRIVTSIGVVTKAIIIIHTTIVVVAWDITRSIRVHHTITTIAAAVHHSSTITTIRHRTTLAQRIITTITVTKSAVAVGVVPVG